MDEARILYEKALAGGLRTACLYNKLGEISLREKDFAQSRIWFEHALEVDAESPRACLGMGLVLFVERDYGAAAGLLEKGLAGFPDEDPYRMVLCDVYAALEEHEKSARHYEYLLARYPDHYLFRYNFATVLEREL